MLQTLSTPPATGLFARVSNLWILLILLACLTVCAGFILGSANEAGLSYNEPAEEFTPLPVLHTPVAPTAPGRLPLCQPC